MKIEAGFYESRVENLIQAHKSALADLFKREEIHAGIPDLPSDIEDKGVSIFVHDLYGSIANIRYGDHFARQHVLSDALRIIGGYTLEGAAIAKDSCTSIIPNWCYVTGAEKFHGTYIDVDQFGASLKAFVTCDGVRLRVEVALGSPRRYVQYRERSNSRTFTTVYTIKDCAKCLQFSSGSEDGRQRLVYFFESESQLLEAMKAV